MNPAIPESWKRKLLGTRIPFRLFRKPETVFKYGRKEITFVYPHGTKKFSTPLKIIPAPMKVKVVMIGQDPHHGAGAGIAVCVFRCDGIQKPPSLVNIFKGAFWISLKIPIPKTGNLEKWADPRLDVVERYINFACLTGGSPRTRDGNIYRCGSQKDYRQRNRIDIFTLGKICTKRRSDCYIKHHLLKSRASFSVGRRCFWIPNISRKPMILKQQDQEIIHWRVG